MHEYAVKADALVVSLSKLINLTNLRLERISENFVDRHMVQLALSLPKLEIWSTDGNWLTDDIWSEVATLKSLRRLDLVVSTSFMTDGCS